MYSKPTTVLALEKYFCSEATLKKNIFLIYDFRLSVGRTENARIR